MGRSLVEQETVVRFDRETTTATLWTAAPAVARKWSRMGYPVEQHGAGWRAEVPMRVLTFRRLGQKPRQGQKLPIPPQFSRVKSSAGV